MTRSERKSRGKLLSTLTTKEKWSAFYGITSTILFVIFIATDWMPFALLSLFHAIYASEYRIIHAIEKGNE